MIVIRENFVKMTLEDFTKAMDERYMAGRASNQPGFFKQEDVFAPVVQTKLDETFERGRAAGLQEGRKQERKACEEGLIAGQAIATANCDERVRKAREEGFQAGKFDGIQVGKREGFHTGYAAALAGADERERIAQGVSKSHEAAAFARGRDEGFEDGVSQALRAVRRELHEGCTVYTPPIEGRPDSAMIWRNLKAFHSDHSNVKHTLVGDEYLKDPYYTVLAPFRILRKVAEELLGTHDGDTEFKRNLSPWINKNEDKQEENQPATADSNIPS